MDAHTHVIEMLGAWALGACDRGEAAVVEDHLRECAECSAEGRRLRSTAGWLGVDGVRRPPAALRGRVLDAARARRAPASAAPLTGSYAGEVALLDGVLGGLTPTDWHRPDPRHRDLSGIVGHLAGNDARLASDLGLRVVTGPDVRTVWRAQSDVLLHGLRGAGGGAGAGAGAGALDLDRPVRLAGKGEPPRRPLREALVQRAFETWIHREDIGALVRRPLPDPPPEQVRRIVGLAVGVLPGALRANGLLRPGEAARLALTGAAGGEWTFPLGGAGGDGDGAVTVTISADATEFVRLVANRRSPGGIRHAVTGDHALATEVLRIAATLGCD
jgi:hypothetical protein